MSLADVCAPALSPAAGEAHEGRRWNEFIGRHRQLGYRMQVGTGMRGAIPECDGVTVAMPAFLEAVLQKVARLTHLCMTGVIDRRTPISASERGRVRPRPRKGSKGTQRGAKPRLDHVRGVRVQARGAIRFR